MSDLLPAKGSILSLKQRDGPLWWSESENTIKGIQRVNKLGFHLHGALSTTRHSRMKRSPLVKRRTFKRNVTLNQDKLFLRGETHSVLVCASQLLHGGVEAG